MSRGGDNPLRGLSGSFTIQRIRRASPAEDSDTDAGTMGSEVCRGER